MFGGGDDGDRPGSSFAEVGKKTWLFPVPPIFLPIFNLARNNSANFGTSLSANGNSSFQPGPSLQH